MKYNVLVPTLKYYYTNRIHTVKSQINYSVLIIWVWTFSICTVNLFLWLNRFSQKSQAKGFWPVWIRTCLLTESLLSNDLLHMRQPNEFGPYLINPFLVEAIFAEICLKICCFILDLTTALTKPSITFTHRGHWYACLPLSKDGISIGASSTYK